MEYVKCKTCKGPKALPGTKQCDACWELDKRIKTHPEIARKLLAAYDKAHPETRGDEPDRGSLSPVRLRSPRKYRTLR